MVPLEHWLVILDLLLSFFGFWAALQMSQERERLIGQIARKDQQILELRKKYEDKNKERRLSQPPLLHPLTPSE